VVNGFGNDAGVITMCPAPGLALTSFIVGGQELYLDDICIIDCAATGCGDGNVDPGEECDDGNNIDGDGCSANCVEEYCGDGIVQPGLGEHCDDGNNINADSCNNNCQSPGDANGDGSIDVSDIVLIVSFILQWAPYELNADANNDGEININDIVLIVCWIIGCGNRDSGQSIQNANFYYGNGSFKVEADADIAGIQLETDREVAVTATYLPPGWEFHQSGSVILMFSLDGTPLRDGVLFDYAGRLEVSSSLVADWTAHSVNAGVREIPSVYQLYQAHPNPFNPMTTIDYSLPEATHVTLKIYNTLGNEIITLVNKQQPGGIYSVTWDAAEYPSGIYFVRMEANGYIEKQKLMLIK